MRNCRAFCRVMASLLCGVHGLPLLPSGILHSLLATSHLLQHRQHIYINIYTDSGNLSQYVSHPPTHFPFITPQTYMQNALQPSYNDRTTDYNNISVSMRFHRTFIQLVFCCFHVARGTAPLAPVAVKQGGGRKVWLPAGSQCLFSATSMASG